MFRDLDARLPAEGKGKNFARSNVPGVVGLGKLRDGESVVSQADRRLGPRTAEWRAGAKQVRRSWAVSVSL